MSTTAPTVAPTDRPDRGESKSLSRFAQWRNERAAKATARTQEATDRARRRREATDRARHAAALAAQRQTTDTRPTSSEPTGRDIAPIPTWLTWIGVWADRTFGALPLAAPLIVSGAYTMDVFTGDVIGAHVTIAFLAACALEGGLWKLSRLYEKTLVAGDSTIALRAGIGVYIALISGLIYWNAEHTAKAEGRAELGEDALPAFGVAIMCALGVYIWSRTARWQRRRELHAAGRIDTQAPKFAALAWILCPVETPKALRHAVKYRIQSPTMAVEDLRLFKAAGRPSVWPPIDPTAPTTDRPASRVAAVKPTDPTVVDRPRQSTAVSTPTAATPTRPIERKPTPPTRLAASPTASTANGDQPTFGPRVIANAAHIRATYGDRPDLKLGTVRSDLGWSFDRADPALKAYHARADQTDQEDATGARPFAHTD